MNEEFGRCDINCQDYCTDGTGFGPTSSRKTQVLFAFYCMNASIHKCFHKMTQKCTIINVLYKTSASGTPRMRLHRRRRHISRLKGFHTLSRDTAFECALETMRSAWLHAHPRTVFLQPCTGNVIRKHCCIAKLGSTAASPRTRDIAASNCKTTDIVSVLQWKFLTSHSFTQKQEKCQSFERSRCGTQICLFWQCSVANEFLK